MTLSEVTQMLGQLTRRHLVHLATEAGVGVPKRARKTELVDALSQLKRAELMRVVETLDTPSAAPTSGQPSPVHAEDAVETAGALSEALRLATSDVHKKKWGQYLTEPAVARFMASLLDTAKEHVRVLDPGAGTGTLGIAAVEHLLASGAKTVELLAVEREPKARDSLRAALDGAKQLYDDRLRFTVSDDDFLGFAEPELGRRSPESFDLVISNPPYFKMPPSEHRGGDSPNIYTRFMEVASRLLRDEGSMCFIIPRSFASGLYFRRFRCDFHARMTLDRVHVFDSRREAFKGEGVLQENIVVHYRKEPAAATADVLISSSAGSADLATPLRELRVPLARVINHKDRNVIVSLPTTDDDLRVMDFLEAWPCRLADHGLEVSTGPVVPFRAKAWLKTAPEGGANVPLLWMQHVRKNGVVFPRPGGFRKPEYVSKSAPAKMLVPNQNYILLRRFSSKEEAKRLTASVYLAGQCKGDVLGLENHLNFIHRPGATMSEDEVRGLAALLNSDLLDRYFRISNGNTQVNATEIRAMPLPTLDKLKAVGARLNGAGSEAAVLEEVLGVTPG